MKKILLFIIFLFIINTIQSQKSKYDIYLVIENDYLSPSVNFKSDTLVWQKFIFKEQKYNDKKSYINEEGVLYTQITIEKSNPFSFTLEYKNLNGNNIPYVLKPEKPFNILKYPSDFNGQKIENILNILKKAEHIYLIENDKCDYYLIKEVVLKD